MKRTLITLLMIMLCSSCSTIKYVPVETVKVEKEYVTLRDTLIEYKIPEEAVSVQTRDTTSHLETSIAVSDASISNGVLNHKLENKPIKKEIEAKIKEVEKIVEVEKEIPVPVEVEKEVKVIPPWAIRSVALNVLMILLAGWFIYRKRFGLR